MVEYIKGILTESTPTKAIIEINGIGYSFGIPLSCFSKLPQMGSPIMLYVYTVIREDSHQYFGFLTRAERDLCETLTSISGIGPKTAVGIIGHIDASALVRAIGTSDVHTLSKLPGIGKKTAERLIVELKDKLKLIDDTPSLSPAAGMEKPLFTDALNALIRLGYSSFQAQKTIKSILESSEKDLDLSTLITAALREIN